MWWLQGLWLQGLSTITISIFRGKNICKGSNIFIYTFLVANDYCDNSEFYWLIAQSKKKGHLAVQQGKNGNMSVK